MPKREPTPPLEPEDTRRLGLRAPAAGGLLLIVLFFGVFGTWSALAPLNSAAVATGIVTVDTQRKTVQHLEGGIVRDILVGEGEQVRADQVLVRFDDVRPRTELAQLRGAELALAAQAARLRAERDGLGAVIFPAPLLSSDKYEGSDAILAGQLKVFETGNRAHRGKVSILEQQIAQSEQEILGLEGQILAEDEQIVLLEEEIKAVTGLLKKGLVAKPRVLALRRHRAELSGSRSRNTAAIARVRKSIGEARIRITELETDRVGEAVDELQTVESRLLDVGQRIQTAEDVLDRILVRAPINGTVVDLDVHTRGGVVAPGARLMDIVPAEERLLVDARIRPQDIDLVVAGQSTQVRLTALPQRYARPLEGRLLSVSADSLVDDNSQQTYYLGRVELIEESLASADGADLRPGMEAQVLIQTGSGTILEYLAEPLILSLERGLREN